MNRLLYEITHTTNYEYGGDVSLSQHLLRLSPREYRRQLCLSHEIKVSPNPATLTAHHDYFGNRTHFLAIESTHQNLQIESRFRVAISPAFVPEPLETPPWERVRALVKDDISRKSLEAHEFTYASPLVPVQDDFADYARDSFTADRPILDAVSDLTRRIHEDFTFDPTATTVTTPVSEVFKQRRGVCQDFVHFQLACLRSHGV